MKSLIDKILVSLPAAGFLLGLQGFDQALSAHVRISPGNNIQKIVDSHPAGTAFILGSGIHRLPFTEQNAIHIEPRTGDTFIGEKGAILSGAIIIPHFERDGKHWVATGLTQQGEVHGEGMRLKSGKEYKGCAFPEDLFIDDKPLWQVTAKSELEPGKWYFDYGADKVYLAEDPSGRKVELSSARHAFSSSAGNVRISSLTIEKYACPAQRGAVQMSSEARGWTIENCDIRFNHGLGVKLFSGAKLHYNRIHHNGQMGVGAIGAGIRIVGNEISYNNYAGFDEKWEAGGTKFVRTTDLVVLSNYSHHNKGPGLWTDIDNIRTLYEGNAVEDNEGEGIMHEISYSAVIRNNLVRRNGFKNPEWGYGAGILISSSPDVEVSGNRVENNARAITLVMQKRGAGIHGPYEVKNVKVHGNEIITEDTYSELYGGNYPREKMYMGLFQDVKNKAYFTSKGNEFSGNVYSSDRKPIWAWMNRFNDWRDWQSYGQDKNGAIGAPEEWP